MTEASEIESITINPQHHLLLLGTKEGRIEAWDPRSRACAGRLDCALSCAEYIKYVALFGFTVAFYENYSISCEIHKHWGRGHIALHICNTGNQS
jgi:hypothetical protein